MTKKTFSKFESKAEKGIRYLFELMHPSKNRISRYKQIERNIYFFLIKMNHETLSSFKSSILKTRARNASELDLEAPPMLRQIMGNGH